jgi:capsular exopolysaccharide synthesis family protein
MVIEKRSITTMSEYQSQLIVHEQAKSTIAEAYRTLRTNLQFAKAHGALQTIIFTSMGPGEGKSTTVANVAIALAQTGKKTLIIDCDLRRPAQHKIFSLRLQGVTNVLTQDIPVAQQLQNTVVPNLQVMTSGPIPPNPSELLGSRKMAEMLETLKQEIDYLLLDTSPVLAVTDTGVLASQADGIVMVVGSGMARPAMAQRAKDLLLKAKGTILGVVLNQVALEREELDYYHYLEKS